MPPTDYGGLDGVGMNFRRLARRTGFGVIAIAVVLVSVWCAFAVWFRSGLHGPARGLLAALPVGLALFTVASLATRNRWRVLAADAVAVVVVLGWWVSIAPSNDRNWAPDIGRTATVTIDGDRLVVSNLRNFAWRSDTDFDQRWETRTYDLARVTDVDLIMSYWAGEAIAHTIISFGFGEGPRLAFSVETRKERGEAYSAIAGFFKEYELAIVAADERDIVRVRSNVRGEDVRIYRLRMTPDNARLLLRRYAQEMNDIARTPRFYDTLTANCTTLVFGMVQTIRPGLPLDPRVLISGYLPDYVYDLGATATNMPLAELRRRSRIHDAAALADEAPDFSVRIREGIPTPR